MTVFRLRPWRTPVNPRKKWWDAEFIGSWHATMFVRVVKVFDKEPVLVTDIVPEYEGTSRIKFKATKEEKDKIEYIYRRFIGLTPRYSENIESYRRTNRKRVMEERYEIY